MSRGVVRRCVLERFAAKMVYVKVASVRMDVLRVDGCCENGLMARDQPLVR
jgi:hypothetical protein